MGIRVRIGDIVIECDNVADLDVVVARYGGAVDAAKPILPPLQHIPFPSIPSRPLRTEHDERLLKALIDADHRGIPEGKLMRLFGVSNALSLSAAIRDFALRVGLQANDISSYVGKWQRSRWHLHDDAREKLIALDPESLLTELEEAVSQGVDNVGEKKAHAHTTKTQIKTRTCGEAALNFITQHPDGVRTTEIATSIDYTVNTTHVALHQLKDQGLVERHGLRSATLWTLPGAAPKERVATIATAIVRVLTDAKGQRVGGDVLRDAVSALLAPLGKKISPASVTTEIYKLIAKKRVARGGADECGPTYVIPEERKSGVISSERKESDNARLLN